MKSQCAFGAVPWNIYISALNYPWVVSTSLYSIIIQFLFDDRSTISHISNIELCFSVRRKTIGFLIIVFSPAYLTC